MNTNTNPNTTELLGMNANQRNAIDAMAARITKRANKLGVTPNVTIDTVTRTEDIGEGLTAEVYDMTITAEAVALPGGWTLTGAIDLHDGANVVHTLTGDTDPAWRNAPDLCTHCNRANTGRHRVFVVTDTEGNTELVGTTCVVDFLGHSVNDLALFLADYWHAIADDNADDDEDGWESFKTSDRYKVNLADFVAAVVIAIAAFGWVPKSRAWGDTSPTSGEAMGFMTAKPKERDAILAAAGGVTEADAIAKATEAIEWAKALTDGDDYTMNLAAICSRSAITYRELGYAASVVNAYDRHLGKIAEKAAKAEADADACHLAAEVGERLEVTATVIDIRYIEGDYGTRTMVKALAEDGARIVWWASRYLGLDAGDVLTGKATVKDHGEFAGVPETTVTRWSFEVVGEDDTEAAA